MRSARRRRARPGAVAIKTSQGESFCDILKTIKSKVNPDKMDIKIRSIEKTRNSEVLIELSASAENKAKFGDKLADAIGEAGAVRQLVTSSHAVVRDLDAATEKKRTSRW